MNILTLTMNPTIDISARAEHVAANRKIRCSAPANDPGGGGINASVAMKELGCESTAVFPCGGPPGDTLQQLLRRRGISHILIAIEGWTRQNLTVYEDSSGDEFRFLMPGPTLSEEERKACLESLRKEEPAPEYIVASGSFPPDVPPDFVRKLVATANKRGARLVVDTSGEALQTAVMEGVFLIKPNFREFKELLDSLEVTQPDIENESGLEKALEHLVTRRHCEVVVLSLGAGGVALATADGIARYRAPTVPIASRVGAGDSTIAGIMTGLSRGDNIRDAVRLGIAAGSAAVMTPGTELCRREDVERLEQSIKKSADHA